MKADIFERKEIHKGILFDLLSERARLPNGLVKQIELIRHPGAAAIVPFLPDGRVLMVRQYRHSVRRQLWEIPAGTMNPGEDPLECAKRELREETGYQGESFDLIGEIFPAPGYSDEKIYLYYASGLTASEQDLDEDEILQVKPIRFERLLQMIERGEIRDAKSICGLFLAARLNPQSVLSSEESGRA